jgi:hypothetical protein
MNQTSTYPALSRASGHLSSACPSHVPFSSPTTRRLICCHTNLWCNSVSYCPLLLSIHCILVCRPSWTYLPEKFGAQGAGYYFDQGTPARYRMFPGRSAGAWQQTLATMMPPQALLAGVYAGSYIKGVQRKNAAHPGYADDAITCPFTLTLLGPNLGASYFRFQVCTWLCTLSATCPQHTVTAGGYNTQSHAYREWCHAYRD